METYPGEKGRNKSKQMHAGSSNKGRKENEGNFLFTENDVDVSYLNIFISDITWFIPKEYFYVICLTLFSLFS